MGGHRNVTVLLFVVVESVGHDKERAPQNPLFSVISCDCHHMCCVVTVGTDRSYCGRSQTGAT